MLAKVVQEEKDWVRCTTLENGKQALEVDGSVIKIVSKDDKTHSYAVFLFFAFISCGIALICRYFMFSM